MHTFLDTEAAKLSVDRISSTDDKDAKSSAMYDTTVGN